MKYSEYKQFELELSVVLAVNRSLPNHRNIAWKIWNEFRAKWEAILKAQLDGSIEL